MSSAFAALYARDLRLALRRRVEALLPLIFFVVVASLFPLGVGSETRLLREIGPGVVWVAALLASLLSLPRLFVADHADGTLEQLLLRPHPLALLALAKVAGHWLTTGLPLVLVSPLLGLQYGLPADAIGVLVPEPAGGHAGAQPAGRGGRGAGAGPARRRRADGADRAAAERAAADLRQRRGAGADVGHAGGRPLTPRRSSSTRWPAAAALAVGAGRAAGVAGLVVGLLVAPTDFQQGDSLPHHLHPRAGGLDVDADLPRDGLLGRLGWCFNTRLSLDDGHARWRPPAR
jgi:hypothetical protein